VKTVTKYHSVFIFLIYVAILNFKQVTYVDALSLTFLAAYVGLSFYVTHNKQPDIRAEIQGILAFQEQQHAEAMRSLVYRYETDIKKLDTDVKEMKTKVASISSLKSVGLSQTQIKF